MLYYARRIAPETALYTRSSHRANLPETEPVCRARVTLGNYSATELQLLTFTLSRRLPRFLSARVSSVRRLSTTSHHAAEIGGDLHTPES